MTDEVRYDRSAEAEAITGTALPDEPSDGMGCHAGADQMQAAARSAGQSELLDKFAKDYPQGPH
ncbi:MAG: chlorophyllide reductase subunit Y, partial [Pseudomonadota bacterium]